MAEPLFTPVKPDESSYSQLNSYIEYCLYEQTIVWEDWKEWAIEYGTADQIQFA